VGVNEDPSPVNAKGRVEIAMAPIDPMAKAAECDRAIKRVADPERRVVLESLRCLWVDLYQRALVVEEHDLATHISEIADLHNQLMASSRMAMH
jgi:hypothetical protein